jgi:hypothetical protein
MQDRSAGQRLGEHVRLTSYQGFLNIDISGHTSFSYWL